MKKLAAIYCFAMFSMFGCVDQSTPGSDPTVSPEELRSIRPLDTARPLELDPTERVCASFGQRQLDLDCYADDLGFICCSYPCARCNLPPKV